ncbi:NUDIX hydrolase [Cytobacillus firmus]|uniref:NUDIX domain-containing protein n=1 Tax=Cytobacillus TaxID=2675230 RepID=UPI002041E6B4|nr:NUDIX hydrolase [Cytobacillus oceanisediminis]MCM3246554.1 NUDIX hydrolase [Cytobacillus oceanisediminis]MCS0822689.1 NUDIX hydrolase [Cytobacillus firmus]
MKNKYITPDGYTSDIAVFTITSELSGEYKPPKKELKIMLIKRSELDHDGNPNMEAGKWALPGGFVRPNETAFQAAERRLAEETGVEGLKIKHFGVYDSPGRDLRGWIMSNAHYVIANEAALRNRKKTYDASEIGLFTLEEALELDLAFDHRTIMDDALWFIKKDMALTTLAKHFLPEEFVLSELQGVLLTVLDDPSISTDAAFFRKAPTLPFIEAVSEDGKPKKSNRYSKTPAQLYRFNDFQPIVSVYRNKLQG